MRRDVRTTRVMQLTGGAGFVSKGVRGVDLGANVTHGGAHYFFFGDVPRAGRAHGPIHDADAIAYATYMDGSRIDLELVTGADGLFAPFRIRFAEGTMGAGPGQRLVSELGTAQTPTGAFSHGDHVYVFVILAETPDEEWPSPVSYLTRSRDPGSGEPFDQVMRFSDGKFWQVAPWVVPSLPELPPSSGEGVVMLGQGFSGIPGHDAVYLAWMPLDADGPRCDAIRFYTKDVATPWAAEESRAQPLWLTTPGYSSISLARIDGADRWVALYSHAVNGAYARERDPVVARIGKTLVDWSDEIVVFDPVRDGAYGSFMHWPKLDDLHLGGIPNGDERAWAYGTFIIAPLTRWDPHEREVTIHYVLSTHRPYQVQLMRSRFGIDVP